MRWLGVLVGCLIPALGVAASSAATSDPFADLRRPFQLPALEPGAQCPVSERSTISTAFAPGLGAGPVYPVGFDEESGLAFEYPPSGQYAGSDWGGTKTLWVARPGYDGRILIRGRRLDRPGEARFSLGNTRVLPELAFAAGQTNASSPGASDWRQFPSATRLREGGCYGFQIDGEDFTRVVVFRAIRVASGTTAYARRGCVPEEVRQLVRTFLGSFNAGRGPQLDRLFATEPAFQWYSAPAPDRRLGKAAYDRATLTDYLTARQRLGERLHLVGLRMNGNANEYFHFSFQLRRTVRAGTMTVPGKGAAVCTGSGAQLAVWSLGGPVR